MSVEPLDGGWGWFVVLASFINNFLLVGLARTFGVSMSVIMLYFNAAGTTVALVASLNQSIRMLGGPLASYVFSKVNGRFQIMGAAVLISLGFISSAFVPSALYLLLTFSVIGGLGGCFIFTPSYIIINQYFDKKRGKALGLATMGNGLGSIVMAPLNSFLLTYYGYQGAMCIIGAMMLNNCVAAALYRPIANNRSRKKYEESTHTKKEPESEITAACNHDLIVNYHKNDNREPDAKEEERQDMLVKDTPDENEDGTANANDKAQKSCCRGCGSSCELFTHLSFILYALEVMCMPLVVSSFCLWLPQYALELGYSPSMGALLVSVQGASDMLGRLMGGILFDLHVVRKNRRIWHTLFGITTASVVIAVGFIPNYWVVLILSAIHGIFEGTYHSQRTSVVAETIPTRLMPASVGVLIFFQGGGVLIGPLIGGGIFDSVGRCGWIFVANGSIFAFFCTLFLLESILFGRSNKMKNKAKLSI